MPTSDPRHIRWAVLELGNLAPGLAKAPFGLLFVAVDETSTPAELLARALAVALSMFLLRRLYRSWFGTVAPSSQAGLSPILLILASGFGIGFVIADMAGIDISFLSFVPMLWLVAIVVDGWYRQERVAHHYLAFGLLFLAAGFAIELEPFRDAVRTWFYPLLGCSMPVMGLLDHWLLTRFLHRLPRELPGADPSPSPEQAG